MPAGRVFNGAILLALLLIFRASPFGLHDSPKRLSVPPEASTRNRAVSPLTENQANRENYVGDGACRSCHEAIDRTYLRTGHHLTSQIPSESSISGKFAVTSNILRTADPNLHFAMTIRDGSYFQSVVFGRPPDELTHTERIDVVVGSGQRGQSYLYWKGDRLFQLPVSYWTPLGEWVNSPGYTDGTAEFTRPIDPRCLECHAGYIASIPSGAPENRYQKTGLVLGITCERCHGPGRQHVAAELSRSAAAQHSPPAASPGKRIDGNLDIVNPKSLSRERQVDVCAQCHGGLGEVRAPAFSFVPGRSLADYLQLVIPDADAKLDVHGNQVALLERSRCFQNSSKMTCTTCHDVHAPERTAAAYSDRCLGCHKPESCGLYPKLGKDIARNCVDCHMQVQDSDVIVSIVDGKQVKMRIRNHWIKVYPASLSSLQAPQHLH
jgi:Cytochrome c554 and c-prime